jgi:hypothetical protein
MEGRCLLSLNLPERASYEYLKKLAKERLALLRPRNPAAKLADAQLAIWVTTRARCIWQRRMESSRASASFSTQALTSMALETCTTVM